MPAAETASGGRVASVGVCVPAAAVQGSAVVLYNRVDRCSGLSTEGWASGACAGGTGLPGFAAGTAEDAHCWGAQGRFSAAAKLPPEGNY